MSHRIRILIFLLVICLALPPAAAGASAQTLPPNCVLEVLPTLETTVICIPRYFWNRDLVVFAHGYEFDDGVSAPKLGVEQWVIQLSNGKTTTLPELVNALGFAFATTSYSKNGLAVQEGVVEMKALVDKVRAKRSGQVRNVYIVGASEGGLITALSMERLPDTYKGGLALCGPVGDFKEQIDYWGDFRALFDGLFPGTFPPTAVNIPVPLMLDWVSTPSLAQAGVIAQITEPANAGKVAMLLGITQAPVDPAVPETIAATTLGILSYNVLATNEARVELSKGQPVLVQPYDNTSNLTLLAAGAQPYASEGDVAAAILPYQTTGMLSKSLVTMHTLGDPIVPVWHETIYQTKVALAGSSSKLTVLPIARYGHCTFKSSEILFSFAMMLYKANQTSMRLAQYQPILESDPGAVEEFQTLNQQFGDISKLKLYLPVVNGSD
jgi:hypothetical protein